MPFTIGKRMVAYPPRPAWEPGAKNLWLTGAAAGLPHTGSIMTCSISAGNIVGHSPGAVAYEWWIGTHTAYASATNASYSMSAADAGSYLTCRVYLGDATYGTQYYQVATGTIIP